MSNDSPSQSLLEELDSRQDELLEELDRLNERIEAVLRECSTWHGDSTQQTKTWPIPSAA